MLWQVKTKFIANSPDEVAQVFGSSFYNESHPQSQPELDERVQLSKFLKTAAFTPICRYPIEVNVLPRDHKPDFRATFGGRIVGIEASKIANGDLEQVRSHQSKGSFGTMELSSFLKGGGRRTLSQKLSDALITPTFIFANPTQRKDEDEFWLKQAQIIIQRKDEISKTPAFNRYDESWLLLWDKLASDEEELQRRSFRLAQTLVRFWHPDRFKKIIIQANYIAHFVILTAQGVELLQSRPPVPGPEVFSMDETLRLE
jgi:hypothetical protein